MVLSFSNTVVIERFWIPLIYLKYTLLILKYLNLFFIKTFTSWSDGKLPTQTSKHIDGKNIILGRRIYLLHREILNYFKVLPISGILQMSYQPPCIVLRRCPGAVTFWKDAFKGMPTNKQSLRRHAWACSSRSRSAFSVCCRHQGCLSRLIPNSFSPVELISEQILLKCRWKAIEWSKWVRLTRTTI